MMFKNGTDLDQALLDVREKVDQGSGALPERAGDTNIMRFSPDELPVVWVSLTGKDADVLTELADNEVVPYFERQEGVASVTVKGAREREIQLIIDEAALNTHGIGADEVTQALQSSNQSTSVGTIDKGVQDIQVRVSGEYERFDEIGDTSITMQEGKQRQI